MIFYLLHVSKFNLCNLTSKHCFLDEDIGQLLEPVLGVVQRVHHVKIVNYIENVVYLYTENDFIIHFRLSREVTNELIDRFAASPIFLALQGLLYHNYEFHIH